MSRSVSPFLTEEADVATGEVSPQPPGDDRDGVAADFAGSQSKTPPEPLEPIQSEAFSDSNLASNGGEPSAANSAVPESVATTQAVVTWDGDARATA